MIGAKIDRERAEAFGDRMLEILNAGAVGVMISIGHRTGLFDTMRELTPSTSAEIAAAAGLNERYVREWLGAMLTGGIVECDEEGRRFCLPAEYAMWLTRKATPNNVAVFAQYIGQFGAVEDQIIDCFHNGGGVPYSAYKRFHQIMAEDSGQTVVAVLTGKILPMVPGLIESLQSGIDVLDVGCGSGRALNLMATTFPNSRFTGYDLSEEAIGIATREACKRCLTNVRFEQEDLTTFEIPAQYDLITAFDAIHDQARPERVLGAVSEALKPDGIFLMQDISASSHMHENRDHPAGPLLYTISCMHCMSVSLAQNGAGLGAMWGREKALELLEAAGFTSVNIKRLPHDFQNDFYIATKQPVLMEKQRAAARAAQV
ncbi:MAG: methyltransferase domain-containing protein [Phycisphaerales bacterium]|nr:MAG: methyltransferase domain-containing protein [Phycisphaerales bacterium]